MVLLIWLMQLHLVATRILADTTFDLTRNKQRVVWLSVAGSGNND
jgi:hypothetical protein